MIRSSAVIFALSLVSLLFLGATDAHAGKYPAAWCNLANDNAGGGGNVAYSPDGSGPTDNAANVQCQNPIPAPFASGNTYGMGTKQTGGSIAQGKSKGWIWSAPASTKFAAFSASLNNARVGQGTKVCATTNHLGGTRTRQCIDTKTSGSWFSGCNWGSASGDPSTVPVTACSLKIPASQFSSHTVTDVWVGIYCTASGGCDLGDSPQFVRVRDQKAVISESAAPSVSSITGDLYPTRQSDFFGSIIVPTTGRVKCETAESPSCGSKILPVTEATDTGAGVNGISYSLSSDGGVNWNGVPLAGQLVDEPWTSIDSKYTNTVKRGCSQSLTTESLCSGSVGAVPMIVLSQANGFNLNGANKLRACTYDYDHTNLVMNLGLTTCGNGKAGKLVRSWRLDNQRPEVLSWSKSKLSADSLSATYTIKFSEAVSGLVAADLSNAGVLSSGSCTFGAPFAINPVSGYSPTWSFDAVCSEDAQGLLRPRLAPSSVYDSSSPDGATYDGSGWSGPASEAVFVPVAPKISALSGPRKTSKSRLAKFTFGANQTFSSFECQIDQRGWAPCLSPKIYRSLRPGRHLFRVRALSDGTAGKAVSYKWRIRR